MRIKRGNFLTFIFSLLPGAGHMYIGFMKMGISFMSMFFFIIFISTWLHIGPLLFFLPLIWFYSFFDCMNKQYLPDEEFSLLEDNYLFSFDKLMTLDKDLFKRRRLFVGILLLLLGIYLIWINIMRILVSYIPNALYNVINNLTAIAPQIIVGISIIIVGIKLIAGKKRESDSDDNA
ncbi:hypothetical protein AB8U03_00815 [Clostridium sp. Mt-5]|uniref:TM2 domain-containing protein n=1 Tax=Clostridium moutaii TaxID=3240932 RepID=A0ABV4BIY1_9CLOT